MPEKIPRGKLVIRAAKEKDLAEIEKVNGQGLFKQFLVRQEGLKTFVATYEGKPIGFCQCGKSKRSKSGIIHSMAVMEGFTKKGVGNKLLGKAHSYFTANGLKCHKAFPLNAAGFYEKAGYRFEVGGKFPGIMTRIQIPKRRKR